MIGVKMNMVPVQWYHPGGSDDTTYRLDNNVLLIVPRAAALVGVNPEKVKAISITFYQDTKEFKP